MIVSVQIIRVGAQIGSTHVTFLLSERQLQFI